MAIYHLNAKTGSRSKGQSAKAKDDYIERNGKYAGKHGEKKIDVQIVISGNMPGWADDHHEYWKAADAYERSNGRLYKEIEFALPVEFTPDERITVAREFADHLTATENLPYTLAIHTNDPENPHCHLMISERANDGIERSASTWFSRANTMHPERGGAKKTDSLMPVEWLYDTREAWSKIANKYLTEEQRIDHRTLAAQGINDRKPTTHRGVHGAARSLHEEMQAIDERITQLETELAEAIRERDEFEQEADILPDSTIETTVPIHKPLRPDEEAEQAVVLFTGLDAVWDKAEQAIKEETAQKAAKEKDKERSRQAERDRLATEAEEAEFIRKAHERIVQAEAARLIDEEAQRIAETAAERQRIEAAKLVAEEIKMVDDLAAVGLVPVPEWTPETPAPISAAPIPDDVILRSPHVRKWNIVPAAAEEVREPAPKEMPHKTALQRIAELRDQRMKYWRPLSEEAERSTKPEIDKLERDFIRKETAIIKERNQLIYDEFKKALKEVNEHTENEPEEPLFFGIDKWKREWKEWNNTRNKMVEKAGDLWKAAGGVTKYSTTSDGRRNVELMGRSEVDNRLSDIHAREEAKRKLSRVRDAMVKELNDRAIEKAKENNPEASAAVQKIDSEIASLEPEARRDSQIEKLRGKISDYGKYPPGYPLFSLAVDAANEIIKLETERQGGDNIKARKLHPEAIELLNRGEKYAKREKGHSR